MLKILKQLFFGGESEQQTTEPKQPYKPIDYAAEVTLRAEHRLKSIEGLAPAQVVEYFHEIITTEFPQYSVKENVAVTELAGDANDSFQLYKTRPYQAYKAEWGQPYTFVLYQDGKARGVVMLGAERSHSQKVKFLIARMYAKKLSLPYINFYTHMPNEVAYVVWRINKFLR